MNKPTLLEDSPDFSLVLGGPLYQLFQRSHLSGGALELLHRRILFIPLFAWLPLLLLSLIGGRALGGAIKIPFLHDIEAHARFLVALPVLVAAGQIGRMSCLFACQASAPTEVAPSCVPSLRY